MIDALIQTIREAQEGRSTPLQSLWTHGITEDGPVVPETATPVVGGGVINVSDTSVFQTPEPIRIGDIEINATSVWTPGAPGILTVDSTPSDLIFNTPNGTVIEVQR